MLIKKLSLRSIKAAITLTLLVSAASTYSQQSTTPSLLQIGDRYWMQPDVVYGSANNTPLKLDVWYPRDNPKPTPVIVYIHGGGWIFGSKEGAVFQLLPYLERGWRAVNVEYRMAGNSLAPGAVEDARCALRWVFRNAKQYNFDTTKIVLTGHSAGGHLSLITGMMPDGTALDNRCYADAKDGDVPMKVAAIVNWYGITDVNDLIAGPNVKNYAAMWMGAMPNAAEVARTVSPLTYVRAALPPIITIHGDKDDVVPYSHATRLHNELQKTKNVHKLVTIKGAGHGMFAEPEYTMGYGEIWKFLRENKVVNP
ncbi:MAG TPA: alpha/beta hydrolase [Pyrinomonadaceae bacterium]|nr:alpha/beta hydrolase [Pyrinomonadaceae bacterium]